MKLVSVIICFLDPDLNFFRQAIESVLAQDYPSLELLLVNDGSGPAASAFAAQMTENFPDKVACLHHPGQVNRGLSASRNLGIRHARGEYVAFLDADDVWLSGKLAEQVQALEDTPDVAMVFGRTLYWHSWSGRAEDQERDLLPGLGFAAPSKFTPPRYLELSLKGRAWVPCVCSIVLRREAVDAIGGFEDAFRDLYEDQVFFAKFWLSFNVLALDKCWDRYRQHPESMCTSGRELNKLEASRSAYLEWLAGYLLEQNCRDKAVWRALERQRLISQICLRTPKIGRLVRRSMKAVRSLNQLLPGAG